MNKKLWILGIAAVSMMMSCSGDDELSSPAGSNPATDGAGIGMNSDVEIRLSTMAGGTRSSIESNDNGFFEAQGIGVFCLAHGYLNVNPNEQPISWLPATGDDTNFSVWMDNLESNAVYEIDEEGDTVATNIKWADGLVRWYPIGNWYRYHFYAYYPRVETFTATETQRVVNLTLDGTQDVIWGRTVSEDPYAYSAKYFRQSPEKADEVPAIAFKHKLMRITFSCEPGVDGKGNMESALNMGVKSIRIKDVPTQMTLVVADYADETNAGAVSYDWTNNLAYFDLKEAGDADFATADHWTQAEVGTAGEEGFSNDGYKAVRTPLGQGILLPVPDADAPIVSNGKFLYTVEIVLVDKDGNEFISEHPIELQNSVDYQAGVSYNVNLTINGPQIIYLNATLDQWVLDDETIDGVEL